MLVGMNRSPIPAAVHPNQGVPADRFEELVEVTSTNADDDVCNICLDDMAVRGVLILQGNSVREGAEEVRIVVRIKACLHKFHKACL